MNGLSLAVGRWVLALAAFCGLTVGVAKADSWVPPKIETYVSANGQFRLTVTPRDIDSPLKYFQTKVEGKSFPEQLAPVSKFERLVDRKWQPVWSNKLVNEVSPVSALVSDDGSRVVTFDNWHSAGYGDNVVVIYGNDGNLVKSLALSQIVPPYFIDGFQRSVSSIWWKDSEPKLTGQLLELGFAAPVKTEDQKIKFVVRIDLEDGSVRPISKDLMAKLKPRFCEAHKSEVAGTNAYLAFQRKDLVSPTGADRDGWTRYWYQAMNRLSPDEQVTDDNLFGDEMDFELLRPGEYMEKDFREGFRQALLAPASEIPRRWFTSVDQEQMTREIETMAKKLKPGQLAGVDLRIFADGTYWPRIMNAMSASGAKLTQIDPSVPIPPKSETLTSLPPDTQVDRDCQF